LKETELETLVATNRERVGSVKMDNKDDERIENSEDFVIEDILESFKIYDGEYKRGQIDAAINV
jgi:hypothetical protein